ncbi:MAG: DUF5666 domain-containing protein [Anaerolineae bacterium]
MKKLLLVLLLVVMLSIGAVPAFAANIDAAKRGTLFNLSGEITAIDDASVTVKVLTGSAVVRPYLGQELVIQVTDSTRFLRKVPNSTVKITFADLVVGDKVSVQGSVKNDVWTATRITADASLIHW